MSQKVYIEYKKDGILSSAYSVTLSSQDGSYGIKKSDGTIIVSNDTSVSNPSTGSYEYTFNPEDNTVYYASWKIVPENGDEPVFVNQTVGPFSSLVKMPVKSNPDIRGNFSQGSSGTLFLSLTDIHSNPITAESISLSISKDGNTVVSSVSPDFVKPGLYAFDWSIPGNLETGTYLAQWEYVADTFSGSEIQSIIISSSGDTSNSDINFYNSRLSDIRVAFSEMISCAQKIPVFHEQALPDASNTKFKLTFPRWNQAYGTRVYRNNTLIENDYEINYFRGTVLFEAPQSSYDTIYADYNFRWFSDEQLDRFLFNALAVINLYPPQSGFNMLRVPDMYIPLILYGAAKDAIRELLMCLQFQQPQQVFGGMEGANKAFSNMETLKKNYEDEFTRLLEQKKYGKYPRVRGIVTPEFTLPGGRSRWFASLFKGG